MLVFDGSEVIIRPDRHPPLKSLVNSLTQPISRTNMATGPTTLATATNRLFTQLDRGSVLIDAVDENRIA